jgi:hypothetical protein
MFRRKEQYFELRNQHISTVAAHVTCYVELCRSRQVYYHELFLRSKHFVSIVSSDQDQGYGARKPSSPGTEPNFYYDTPQVYLPSNRVFYTEPLKTLVNNILRCWDQTPRTWSLEVHCGVRCLACASLSHEQPFASSVIEGLQQTQFASPSLSQHKPKPS